MNRLKHELDKLRNQGFSPSAIFIKRAGKYWQGQILLDDGHHPLDGFNIDSKDLPTGVAIGGWQRMPDHLFLLASDKPEVEQWLSEFADAQDWARFDGADPTYPHYLIKLNAWRSVQSTPKTASQRSPNNQERQAGAHSGRKQRQKDQAAGVYPRLDLPINRTKGGSWTAGYEQSYYAPSPAHRAPVGSKAKISITVRVDADLLEDVRSAHINISRACEQGLRAALSSLKNV